MDVHLGDFILGTGLGRIAVPEAMFNEMYERVRE